MHYRLDNRTSFVFRTDTTSNATNTAYSAVIQHSTPLTKLTDIKSTATAKAQSFHS